MTLGSKAPLEDRLPLQETKANLLRRIARHQSPLLRVDEPLDCDLEAEAEADRLRGLLTMEGQGDV